MLSFLLFSTLRRHTELLRSVNTFLQQESQPLSDRSLRDFFSFLRLGLNGKPSFLPVPFHWRAVSSFSFHFLSFRTSLVTRTSFFFPLRLSVRPEATLSSFFRAPFFRFKEPPVSGRDSIAHARSIHPIPLYELSHFLLERYCPPFRSSGVFS